MQGPIRVPNEFIRTNEIREREEETERADDRQHTQQKRERTKEKKWFSDFRDNIAKHAHTM